MPRPGYIFEKGQLLVKNNPSVSVLGVAESIIMFTICLKTYSRLLHLHRIRSAHSLENFVVPKIGSKWYFKRRVIFRVGIFFSDNKI